MQSCISCGAPVNRPRARLCLPCKAERIKERDRVRGQDPERKVRVRANHHRYANGLHKKEWQKRNPEKRRAQVAVGNAVRDGRLIKPTVCSVCQQQRRITAHHDDYAKPLDVRWLCTVCHGAEHRALNEQERAA